MEKEEASRQEMGMLEKDAKLELEDNSALSSAGKDFLKKASGAVVA